MAVGAGVGAGLGMVVGSLVGASVGRGEGWGVGLGQRNRVPRRASRSIAHGGDAEERRMIMSGVESTGERRTIIMARACARARLGSRRSGRRDGRGVEFVVVGVRAHVRLVVVRRHVRVGTGRLELPLERRFHRRRDRGRRHIFGLSLGTRAFPRPAQPSGQRHGPVGDGREREGARRERIGGGAAPRGRDRNGGEGWALLPLALGRSGLADGLDKTGGDSSPHDPTAKRPAAR